MKALCVTCFSFSTAVQSYVYLFGIYIKSIGKESFITWQNSELMDKLTAAETETAELHNNVEELEYNLDVSRTRIDKYDRHLSDAMAKVRTYEEGTVTIQGGGEGVSRKKVSHCKTTAACQNNDIPSYMSYMGYKDTSCYISVA